MRLSGVNGVLGFVQPSRRIDRSKSHAYGSLGLSLLRNRKPVDRRWRVINVKAFADTRRMLSQIRRVRWRVRSHYPHRIGSIGEVGSVRREARLLDRVLQRYPLRLDGALYHARVGWRTAVS